MLAQRSSSKQFAAAPAQGQVSFGTFAKSRGGNVASPPSTTTTHEADHRGQQQRRIRAQSDTSADSQPTMAAVHQASSSSSLRPHLASAASRPTIHAAQRARVVLRATKKSIPIFNPNDKRLRDKADDSVTSPKVLTRIQELRLLSKAEEAGLLSAAENAGITLATVEKLGLLSKAESLGIISAAGDRKTPGLLRLVTIALFVAGPAAVYFLPEDTTQLVAAQAAVATLCAIGGAAAFGGATLLSNLQSR